ncbi:hypothetical protein [Halomarina litorea]|uniref:hypothetical protein n=1 Tax=Halomarina litorea TaxID=2961595 RepID=UPI0020C39C99|nr:hypothetical protein [Halomarina sp. BCD28]
MPDPNVVLRDVLRSNWDASATSVANAPVFHTGWYDRDGDMPCITITNMDEGPYRGGVTGLTGLDGETGKGRQRLSGFALVNCVAGTRDDCEGIGTSGNDVNPKIVRNDLFEQASQILLDESPVEFRSLAPGDSRDIVDTDDGPAVFRTELRAVWLRDRTPTA